MQNFINGLKSFIDIIYSVINVMSGFMPLWMVYLLFGFLGLTLFLVALRIVAKILDAIPIL